MSFQQKDAGVSDGSAENRIEVKVAQCGEGKDCLVISESLRWKNSEEENCQFMKVHTLLNCQYSH